MTTNFGKRRPIKQSSEPQAREEEIRRRAYQLYEDRGCKDGHDVDDWLRGEAEIKRSIRAVGT